MTTGSSEARKATGVDGKPHGGVEPFMVKQRSTVGGTSNASVGQSSPLFNRREWKLRQCHPGCRGYQDKGNCTSW